jgi:hypothetical protein
MAFLYGRGRRLTTKHGGFRPGQTVKVQRKQVSDKYAQIKLDDL